MTRSIAIALPWPPTMNTYWRSVLLPKGKGSSEKTVRVMLSQEGREYRARALQAITHQRIPLNAITGKLAVSILAYPPDRRDRDLDNLLKGLLDALKSASVIRDDADIDDLRIRRGAVRPGGLIHIALTEIPGAATESGGLFEQSNEVAA